MEMASPVIQVGEPKKKGRFVKQPAGEKLPAWQSFLFSTIAPQLAVLFTNPFDTAKVRDVEERERVKCEEDERIEARRDWKEAKASGLGLGMVVFFWFCRPLTDDFGWYL